VILYEYPLNERTRTYLRLQHLFARFNQLSQRSEALDHHYALTTMFEIMEVASRSELKSEILKDIERHKQQLNSYRGNPSISEQALDLVIEQLDQRFEALNSTIGKIGSALGESEFLNSIRSRSAIPGGHANLTCLLTTHGNTMSPPPGKPICSIGRNTLRLWPKPFNSFSK